MDKEKQIEEMAHIMGSRCMNTCPEMTCPKCGATSLYDAGYGNLAELKAENRTLKDRISALEIDQSQFEELEKQLAIYKRALEIQIGNQMRTQSLLSPTAADISYIMKCRIQQAEKELEEQHDNEVRREFAERLKDKMPKLDEGEKGDYFNESEIDDLLKQYEVEE